MNEDLKRHYYTTFYQPDQKFRYIEQKQKSAIHATGYLCTTFSHFGYYEKKLNKDLCNFTLFELQEVYKFLCLPSEETIRVANSYMSMYTNWCIQEGLVEDGQNHFSEMDSNRIRECVNQFAVKKKYVTREQVLEWIRQIPNPRDQYLILALFEMGSDNQYHWILSARLTDIFKDGDVYKLHTKDGRDVVWSEELVNIARNAAEEDFYYPMTEKSRPTALLGDPDLIFKNKVNTVIDDEDNVYRMGKRAYTSLVYCFRYLGVDQWMTAKDLRDSGIIYRIKQYAEVNGISEVLVLKDKEFIRELKNQYNIVDEDHFITRTKRKLKSLED